MLDVKVIIEPNRDSHNVVTGYNVTVDGRRLDAITTQKLLQTLLQQ